MIECNQIDASAAVPRQGMGIRLAFRAHAENISSSSRRKPTRNVAVSSLEVHVSSSRKTSPCFPRTSSHPSNYSYHHYKPGLESLPLTHLTTSTVSEAPRGAEHLIPAVDFWRLSPTLESL
ncbi:hypothetical protein ACFX2I_031275 [Malus domestica]